MPTLQKQEKNGPRRPAFVVYERWHVEALDGALRERSGSYEDASVLALSVETERELEKRRIPFFSGRIYKNLSSDLLASQDAAMEAFFADPRWKQFAYRGVELPATFLFSFRSYLQSVWYYGGILTSFLEAHPDVSGFVPFAPNGFVGSAAGSLAKLEREAAVDCARALAAQAGLSFSVIQSAQATRARARARVALFHARRLLFGLFLSGWNVAIALLRRPRRPRILISDYWRHVGSSIELLEGAECLFLDRLEIRAIPWRALLRRRMRFVHGADFLSRAAARRARAAAREYARAWRPLRSSILPTLSIRGHSFDGLLLGAVDELVRGFEKLLRDIEGAYALYGRFKPDLVMLRASVSAQTHFSILPLVAKQLGVPSLEIQHGLEYLGPGSWSREHAAEHIASYGSLIKEELVSIGYAPRQVHEIGSPRFDALGKKSKDGDKLARPFTVLCVAPDIRIFEIYDSYSAEDYFSTAAAAIGALPGARAIIKFRPGSPAEDPLRLIAARAFSRVPYDAASSDPLPALFDRADAVVSCYSTVVLEALTCGMPVIIPALNPIDAAVTGFHFSRYRDAGALSIASNEEELATALSVLAAQSALRRKMSERARSFVRENFRFDGRSSARCAALIAELARQPGSLAVE
ncbi:MAG: hypothetical protein KGH56_01575 [Patescibacteria group bacterium]|nr:hypothetical protein [Patescibacteria group bacterium]